MIFPSSKCWLAGSWLVLSSPTWGQPPAVPERLVYELTNSILNQLRPQALTWYRRDADGVYRWHQPQPTNTPAVRLVLQDRLDAAWCRGLLCAFGSTDSARYEQQLCRYFTAADLAYMRQQLPAAARFRFRQAGLTLPWVRVVPLDILDALRRRLGWQARVLLGDSVLRRFGSPNPYHISRLVFSQDHRRALATVGDAYNGYTVAVYRKVGAAWRREADVVMVDY